MFRNVLAAALRNLSRNVIYASISIAGLAIGFATAILIALFIRDELSYERFIPGHDRTYLLQSYQFFPSRAPYVSDHAIPTLAARLKLDFPQIRSIARIYTNDQPAVRRGEIENIERVYWADSNIFDLLPLSTITGDLHRALENPNSVVLTQNMARKYFGDDDPIGKTLELNRVFPVTVTAVLKDLPSNTHIAAEIIGSRGMLAQIDRQPPHYMLLTVLLYFQLAPGASIADLEAALPEFVERHYPKALRDELSPGLEMRLSPVPLDQIHLSPPRNGVTKPHGRIETIYILSAIGVLIVAIAGMNFVNLMTARGARRALEVGIRKVAGASQRNLVHQFIGESLIYAAIGMLLALALVELLLPWFNAFLARTIAFEWWLSPTDIAAVLAFVVLVAVLAGCYPAFVLSSFKPASAMKSGRAQKSGSGYVRQGLVILQCATMIGLILATTITYRQIDFALNEAMRIDKDEVLLIRAACRTAPDGRTVTTAFRDQMIKLPGVLKAGCASERAIETEEVIGPVTLPDGTNVSVSRRSIGFGFFDVFGVRPLAGRIFSEDRPSDALPADPKLPMSAPVVINERAMRSLNFATPQEAIGRTILVPQFRAETRPSEVIGVVPDFSMDSIRAPVTPVVYVLNPQGSNNLTLKLDGTKLPETLRDVDALWKAFGNPRPITRVFLDQFLDRLYRDIRQQGAIFAVFAGIALFIAGLGLFGLSAFAAERRTKEIGIRKAMGASSGNVLWLLTWDLTKPVLWANLIAWPTAYFLMDRWLSGFAQRIDLDAWIFIAAGVATLLIAWSAVSGLSILAARAKPVTALRYE